MPVERVTTREGRLRPRACCVRVPAHLCLQISSQWPEAEGEWRPSTGLSPPALCAVKVILILMLRTKGSAARAGLNRHHAAAAADDDDDDDDFGDEMTMEMMLEML
eukprot:1883884-Rhodomonas_salina.1